MDSGTRDSSSGESLTAVLEAVDRGESVIAVNGSKKPWYSWKRYQEQPASADEVRGWAKSSSCTGFAVVTGAVSGLVILDFDDADGIALCEKLKLEPHVQTPGGGFHVRFRHPGFRVATQNSETTKRLQERWHGLDIRADGGYAVEWGRNKAGEYRALRELAEADHLDRLPHELRVDLGLVENGKRELPVQAEDTAAEDTAPEPPSEPDEPRKYTHPGRHAHLLGVGGAMRGRGEDEAAILKELRRVNKAECEPPKPDAEVVALAKDVAERYAPDKYRVSYDEKGRLKLPAKPGHDDRLALCAWLTGVFELDVSHPIVAARRYGGAEGSVVLERVGARNLHFNSYSRLIVPVRFRETLCGQLLDSDGQPPGFKNEHLNKVEHVVRMLAAGFKAEDDRILTDGIVSTFLHEAEHVKGEFTTYGDSQERYRAAAALRPATDWGQQRYLIDVNTGEYVIRVSDLAAAARKHTGTTIPKPILDARMEEYGWTRVELQGYELPGREGRFEGDHARPHVYRGLVR